MTCLVKNGIRTAFRQQRQSLSLLRRQQAAEQLCSEVLALLPATGYVASFASFGDELCTGQLNEKLVAEQRLLLPKVVDDSLSFYEVSNLNSQLEMSRWGILEPIPSLCVEIDPMNFQIILVPGLVFDSKHQRIGYGKGCYDRFLKQFPHLISYGIGFKEQLSSTLLPNHHHDVSVSHVLFV